MMELLSVREHGVLVVRGPRERLSGLVGGLGAAPSVIVGPPTLTTAAGYADALVSRCGESLRAMRGGRAAEELAEVSRGLGWEGRLRGALGLVRDELPRRKPPLRLVCVCCPATVTDEDEQARLVSALLEYAPELPWFYGIRVVVHAPDSIQVEARPPFVQTWEATAWSPRSARVAEERSERWIR